MTTDDATLDAVTQAERVRGGDASPVELVDAAIARIEKRNAELGAVILPRFEKAREEAASSTRRGDWWPAARRTDPFGAFPSC